MLWLLCSLQTLLLTSCSKLLEVQDSAPEVVDLAKLNSLKAVTPKKEHHSPSVNRTEYTVLGKNYKILASNQGYEQVGGASWYGSKFHGRDTSSGQKYDMYALTAAHKTLRIPCYVEVENLDNNKSIVVKVNDRGPFHSDRIIDLSYAAAYKLDMLASGTAVVRVKIIDPETSLGSSLQVGSFSRLEYAQDLITSLKEVIKPYPIALRSKVYNNSKVYKVFVEKVPDADIQDIKTTIANNFGISAFIAESN